MAALAELTAPPRARTQLLRADIQGLRAVAVMLVILSHIHGWPPGGFIGVDVFFVISGFLITGLLLHEHERSGRISLVGFYRRRARRIIPVASTVLVSTVAVSFLLFFTGRARDVLSDSIWSFTFAANWHLALNGANYQLAGGAVSPLQHFWSLAVEEQFYVVWPWLLLLVLTTGRLKVARPLLTARTALNAVIVAVTLGSFAWGLWETAAHPAWAYFSTFSRAWELGAGAALAAFSTQLRRLPDAARVALAWTGMAAIAAAALLIDATTPFPAPGALLPVLGTAAVIAAGTGGVAGGLVPLTNPVMGYIGTISYSLYLWHWPVQVFVPALLPGGGLVLAATKVALTIGLGVLSFHLVEDPIRRSTWLEPRAQRRPTTARSALLTRRTALAAALVLGATGGLGARLALRDPRPAPSASGVDAAADVGQRRLTASIDAALAARKWPDLTPSLDEISAADKSSEWVEDGCLGGDVTADPDPQRNAAHCVYGDPAAQHTAVVLGDSMAISYVPGIRAALEPLGWKIQLYTQAECPALTATVLLDDGSAHPTCDPFRDWALTQIDRKAPDLAIMTSSEDSLKRFVGTPADPIEQWRSGTETTLDRLRASGTRVVILSPPPESANIQVCATRFGAPADCVDRSSAERDRIIASDARSAAAAGRDVTFVDTTSWFCSASDFCPSFIGRTLVYADGGHLTDAYSARLGPFLRDRLLGAAGTAARAAG